MTRKRDRVRNKHPLLLYRRLAAYYRTPLLLLMLVSAALLVWDHPALRGLQPVLVLTLALALLLLLLTFIMSRIAYVQCRENGLLVQLPLYRLYVPYESVLETRAVLMYDLFSPSDQPFSSRGFLDPLWERFGVVVRLRRLPLPRSQLRLWMDSRMIVHDGLVFLVADYRGFRRQMQDAMIHWRAGRRDSRQTLTWDQHRVP